MLEVQVGECDVVSVDVGENARKLRLVETGWRQQQAFGIGQQHCGNGRNGKVGQGWEVRK